MRKLTREKIVNNQANEEMENENVDNSDKVILCNDPICEGDSLADKSEEANLALEIANEEIKSLSNLIEQMKKHNTGDSKEVINAKIAKLIGIMSLTDESVKHIKGGYMQKLQVAEYYKVFPEQK